MKELQKLVSRKDAKAQRKTTTKIIMGALTRKKLQNNRKNYLAQRRKEKQLQKIVRGPLGAGKSNC